MEHAFFFTVLFRILEVYQIYTSAKCACFRHARLSICSMSLYSIVLPSLRDRYSSYTLL